MDETVSGEYGYWMGLGEDREDGRQITSLEWLDRLAPGAAAVLSIGTCACWGGIPAAQGNPTNAMGVMDHLGKDYRSALGLPVINIPGCSPVGDNITETAAAALLFLNGLAPLPEFDELGRPAWLFTETVHRHCPRAGYYEEGVFAHSYGDKECLVELGCWGPIVQCNIAERGIVDGHGGCMNMGGICIGCTMPGFPDKFSPHLRTPAGRPAVHQHQPGAGRLHPADAPTVANRQDALGPLARRSRPSQRLGPLQDPARRGGALDPPALLPQAALS